MGWENAAEFKKKAEEWENKIIKMNANETKDSVLILAVKCVGTAEFF